MIMTDQTSGSDQKPIRIILVDDGPAIFDALGAALSRYPTMQVIGQAGDRQEALQLCQLTGPEVVLVNLTAAGLDAISVIRWIALQWPQITILALTCEETEAQLREALEAGANGYLPVDAAPETLAATIQHVMGAKSHSNMRPELTPLPDETPEANRGDADSLRKTELVEAARIQSSLLPSEPPIIPGWDLAVRLQPARETSGDFFDFLPLDHGKYGIVIGDVSDKGLGAALFMAMTSTLFRTYTARQTSMPALTMSLVNERILSDTGGSSFVTAFLGVLEPQTGRLRYVNAGHMPPLMISSQKGKKVDYLERTGMALGVLNEAAWGQKLIKFSPGEFLLLYTDGVLDAQNSREEYYGPQRLQQAARVNAGGSARQIVDAILADVVRFGGDTPVSDDVILMALVRKK